MQTDDLIWEIINQQMGYLTAGNKKFVRLPLEYFPFLSPPPFLSLPLYLPSLHFFAIFPLCEYLSS